jgi:hypothetical protein
MQRRPPNGHYGQGNHHAEGAVRGRIVRMEETLEAVLWMYGLVVFNLTGHLQPRHEAKEAL